MYYSISTLGNSLGTTYYKFLKNSPQKNYKMYIQAAPSTIPASLMQNWDKHTDGLIIGDETVAITYIDGNCRLLSSSLVLPTMNFN